MEYPPTAIWIARLDDGTSNKVGAVLVDDVVQDLRQHRDLMTILVLDELGMSTPILDVAWSLCLVPLNRGPGFHAVPAGVAYRICNR